VKLIAEKYRKLKPTIDHLADEVVVTQAWKKTHSYMRTHNWYADTLALDVSALGLESNAALWAKNITSSKSILTKLKLIPAAKSEKWVVDKNKGWIAESLLNKNGNIKRNQKPPIRPLAHLSVRDQTWATSLMLCLADAVETAQGDCSGNDYFKAQKNKVYSYGNRLLCDWRNPDDAWFRWGNGETYRKFFTDYQGFLKRPIEIGKSVASNHSDYEHVFIINIDLSKFYDHIDRTSLMNRLKKIAKDYYDIDECTEFWNSASKITSWKWEKKSQDVADSLGLELGDGLPQGLVASGFFANAYLIEFDAEIGKHIGKQIPKSSGVEIHDYCRYVDDLRLVVSIEDINDIELLSAEVNKWISYNLIKYAGEKLEINPDKTKVISLSDLDNSGTLSARINQIQEEISGPTDRDSLDGLMGVLEGLLTLQTDGLPNEVKTLGDQSLLRLAKFDHDVRPGTLKRFAANRLESIIRNKRKIGVSESSIDIFSGDNESELLAKKLIWAWMQDPSLALVLRKALEIYPSPDLIEPILEALFNRSSFTGKRTDSITAAMVDYLLADLFRSCVDFHGFFQRIEYPYSSDPSAMLSLAARFAQKAVSCSKLPEFVERQALLLLAVMQLPIGSKNTDVSIQHNLHAILRNSPFTLKRQNLALYEVAAQITGKPDVVAALLFDHMEDLKRSEQVEVFNELSKRGGIFWISIWKRLKKQVTHNEIMSDLQWAAPVISYAPKPVKQRLSRIISSNLNGFVHEASIIKLAISLSELFIKTGIFEALSPNEISIKQIQKKRVPWDEIWKPDVKFECEVINSKSKDPRFNFPSWLIDDEYYGHDAYISSRVIYSIGCILRAAAVGSVDFTSSRWKLSNVNGYKGLRTGWYKRRMGMMHSPENLVGKYGTISGWGTELLMTSLQWPGFEASYLQNDDIAQIENIETFKATLINRLSALDNLYCEASQMPALITQVKRPKNIVNNKFRLVTVQQLLPRTEDFSLSDPMLDSPNNRKRNRDHLSRICQLTYKTLTATLQAEKSLENTPGADLIVFPEVAVHPDDEDLLKRLADKTHSMIFAGLTFQDISGDLVNIARWYIPDYRDSGRQWIIRDQGKAFTTTIEDKYGVKGFRPCQHIIEVIGNDEGPFKLSGAICYDATDLKLASDLKEKTQLFVVVAHNKDVSTFDTMASALHYHMYQHVVLVNKGEFGGSTIQAPYRESFDKLVSHAHGKDQISINVADLDLAAFIRKSNTEYKAIKTKPAG